MKPDYPTAIVIAWSVLLHPGLLIVDHIHFQVSLSFRTYARSYSHSLTFQYNGFLLGILLWSVVAAREVSEPSLCESRS